MLSAGALKIKKKKVRLGLHAVSLKKHEGNHIDKLPVLETGARFKWKSTVSLEIPLGPNADFEI